MYKILKIVVGVLSFFGCVFLARIMYAGDTVLKSDYIAEGGNSELVDGLFNPFAIVMYIAFAFALAAVIFFVFKDLFTSGKSIKNTLIGGGAFVGVLLIAFLLSGGDTMQYLYDDEVASDSASRLVGSGLVAFYLLSVISIIAVTFSGIKKLIK